MQVTRLREEEQARALIRLAVQTAVKMAMGADPTLTREEIALRLGISFHTVNGWCAEGRESVPESPTLIRMVLDARVLPAVAREQLCRTLMTGCGLVVSVPAKADESPAGEQVLQIAERVGTLAGTVKKAGGDGKIDAAEAKALVDVLRGIQRECEEMMAALGEG